jgi:putative OPT family oligopeptide transporter
MDTESPVPSTNITAPSSITASPLPSASAAAPAESGHQPYVPDSANIPEFTLRAVLLGAVLGIVFGASSLYLVLKVGMTVSASIPVAVLSITLFRVFTRLFGRGATILENNIVQTTGSAGESIAFGVGVTMPALLLIGSEITFVRVMVVSLLGGILGILMMIPLRRAFIVQMHGKPGEPGKLLYPEGTACAQVLMSGEKGGTSGATVFLGFAVAFIHKMVTEGMILLRGTIEIPLKGFSAAASIAGDLQSELLGVGYIIGLRISAIMMAGGVVGGLVITPTLFMTGEASGLKPDRIYEEYLRFIGAGCVSAAGIISMVRTLPMIVRSFLGGVSTLRSGKNTVGSGRTENDLPPSFVAIGCLVLVGLLTVFLHQEVGLVGSLLGALLVLVFGFLFVTVSSRLTGEIGSSSNPISGMTVATLLLTCVIFLALGMKNPTDAILALSIGGVVCIAASNGGTTSQDLKTGFLVGGTPRLQQWAIIVGALTSAVIIGWTLLLFNSAGIVHTQRNLTAETEPLPAQLPKETEVYEGETFHVWRPIESKKYLLDSKGQLCYRVDPTITGTIKQRDTIKQLTAPLDVQLTKDELAKLEDTMSVRDEANKLAVYHIWANTPPQEGEKASEVYRTEAPKGIYLVTDEGHTAYSVETDPVRLKFKAPKTEVMGLIVNGLLNAKLKWAPVLIGAFLAVALELCGVSSLAFAVGVYIPMSASTPIFLGGLIRWAVDALAARRARGAAASAHPDDAEARARAEVEEIAKSETSPGVLLASGLIAGGSLAGVLIAFLDLPFFELIKKAINFGPVPYFRSGEEFDLPPIIVFSLLMLFLAVVGAGFLFRPKPEAPTPPNTNHV